MQCFSPVRIRNKSPGPDFNKFIDVPCGKCAACLSNKRKQWSFRISEEMKNNDQCFFVTLTYDDDHLPLTPTGRPTTRKKDVQDFFKRLRKELGDVRLRYYLVSEYGPTTYRPHYHCILFFRRCDSVQCQFTLLEADNLFVKVWHNGFTCTEAVTPATINYVTKYVITRRGEMDDFDDRERPFSLSSRRPGIGQCYVDRMKQWHSDHPLGFYATELGGTKVSLPRYYVDKLYTDVQRRAHSLQVQQSLKEKPVCETYDYEQAYTQRLYKRIDKMQKL